MTGYTDESTWHQWDGWADLPDLALPAAGQRVVVVSAHPDDEVLALGGLLQRLGRGGCRVEFVTVTDGEASHPASPTLTPGGLASRRAHELAAALSRLGHAGADRLRLGLPDSQLEQHPTDLVDRLVSPVTGAAVAVAPWSRDGHPDHEACGRATVAAARGAVPVWEYPVWAWHWANPWADPSADPEAGPRSGLLPWPRARVVRLNGEEQAAKAAAVGCFESQVASLSDDPRDSVVLPVEVLAHFRRPHEVVFT